MTRRPAPGQARPSWVGLARALPGGRQEVSRAPFCQHAVKNWRAPGASRPVVSSFRCLGPCPCYNAHGNLTRSLFQSASGPPSPVPRLASGRGPWPQAPARGQPDARLPVQTRAAGGLPGAGLACRLRHPPAGQPAGCAGRVQPDQRSAGTHQPRLLQSQRGLRHGAAEAGGDQSTARGARAGCAPASTTCCPTSAPPCSSATTCWRASLAGPATPPCAS